MPTVQELVNPQKNGFLTKFGGRGLKSNWSKRWFVIKDGNLYYFKHNTPESKDLKTISLKKYNKLSEGGKGKKYSFKLESAGEKERVYYIYAENQEVMQSWMDAISAGIKEAANMPDTLTSSAPVESSTSTSPTTSPPTSPTVESTPSNPVLLPLTTAVSSMTLESPTSPKGNSKGKICTLYVNIAEARNLPPCDIISGKCDPYVIIDAANCQIRTQTIFKSLNPFFGEDFYMDIADTYAADPKASVKLTVWDDDRFIKDTLIGQIVVPISSLRDGKLKEQWYPIFPADYEVYVSGDLHLKLHHDTTAKQLKLTVVAGRNLASKDANGLSDPYVQISFNNKKYKTKVIKKTLNPTFDEEFVLDIPNKFYEQAHAEHTKGDLISISCWDWDAVGANEFMGEVLLHVNDIEANKDSEVWYILMPKGNLSESENSLHEDSKVDHAPPSTSDAPSKSTGELRMKLKYTEDIALPVSAYDPIYEVLLGERGPEVALILEQIVGPTERGELATALVRASEAKAPSYPLLSSLAKSEILQTQHAETIFRGNSLATKGIDAYMKLVALPYLQEVIGPTVKKIFEYKKSCEVDPTREKEENIAGNFKRLVKFANELTTSIFSSAAKCPKGLRDLFKELQDTVAQKWGADSVARYSAVSSFLFLRHICPALLNPKLFELTNEHADQKTARILTLLSKTIQNLANLVEFGQKEPYMLKMNEFILENMPKMKAFLNEVAKPETGAGSENPTPKSEEILVKKSAALFRYFDKSLPGLKALESTNPEPHFIAKIVAAVEKVQAVASS